MLARFAVCPLAAVFVGLPAAGRALGAAVANDHSPADRFGVGAPDRRASADEPQRTDLPRRPALAAAVDEEAVGVNYGKEITQHLFEPRNTRNTRKGIEPRMEHR
jgi:hypothetical protein